MNFKPLQCDFHTEVPYEVCQYQCFSLAAMEDHMKIHYPEAAKNEREYWLRIELESMQNVYQTNLPKTQKDIDFT